MSFLTTIVLILFVLVCALLIFLVLIQTSKGGSLFGSGGSQSVFGSSTVDILTKATRFIAVSFMILSLLLSYLFAKKEEGFIPTKEINQQEDVLDKEQDKEN